MQVMIMIIAIVIATPLLQLYIVVVGDTSNFHFDTILSGLGIGIDGIECDTDT